MADRVYKWTDDPMLSGVKDCDPDVVNECLMSLKYENTSDAIQNMYETGSVETQTRAFAQLKEMRYSTFDLSKFTVVGSPTITDDGVASGGSSTSYIDVKPNLTDFRMIMPVKLIKGYSEDSGIKFCLYSRTSRFSKYYGINLRYEGSNNSLLVSWYNPIDDNTFETIIPYSPLISGTVNNILNEQFFIEFIKQDNNYSIGYSKDGLNYTTVLNSTYSNEENPFSLEEVYILKDSRNSVEVDLKQFSIIVAGVDVFSGNKTGLDVIKPDHYEVVGSPVISDDGVASGFSSGNYLTTNVDLSNKCFVIETPSFVYSNISSENQYVFLYGTYNNGLFLTSVITPNGNITFNIRNSSDTVLYHTSYNAILGYKYQAKFVLNKSVVEIYIKENEEDYTLLQSIENTSLYEVFSKKILIGTESDASTKVFKGSIDLNSFKIYVDGNLVYQPCLKIPYTKSKTGSKIVDVAYRDRVIDLYEQQGQAGYYTIDEENKNFTLPMGEVYGMIEQKVSKTGDTMNGPLSINTRWNDKLAMIHPDLDINSTTAPEQSIATHVTAIDKNGKWVGNFGIDHTSDNKFQSGIVVRRIIDGTEKRATFELGVDASGNKFYNPAQLITSYVNGTSGYNIWSNGYCEQWGQYHATGHRTITFAKTFKDKNYNVTCTTNDSGTSYAWFDAGQSSASKVYLKVSDTSRGITISWRACGYLAQGQY